VNNWKVIFATIIIFGAGVVTGGLLVSHVEKSRSKAVRHPSTNSSNSERVKPHVPEMLNRSFLQRLDGDLNLTREQHATIQKIMNEGQNQMRKAVQDARLEIREVLTPEQRKEFDDLVKRPFRKPIFPTNAPATLKPAGSGEAAP
jgi:LTXXQ motif family protein